MANLIPTFNCLLVQVIEDRPHEKKSAGGIVLPGKVNTAPLSKGVVLARGPGYFAKDFPGNRIPICCDVGDTVYFRQNDFFYLNTIDLGQALVPDTSVMAIEKVCPPGLRHPAPFE